MFGFVFMRLKRCGWWLRFTTDFYSVAAVFRRSAHTTLAGPSIQAGAAWFRATGN
jgi:hypothetical protein